MNLSQEEGEAFVDVIEKAKSNIVILPSILAEIIKDYDDENINAIEFNANSLIAFMCEAALIKIDHLISVSAKNAKLEMSLSK